MAKVIYSVTINVDRSVLQDWLSWMRTKHIPDVMNTGCFTAYGFHRLVDPPQEDESVTFNVQYACQDYSALAYYREHHAPTLQAESTERYGSRFVAFRTILEDVAE